MNIYKNNLLNDLSLDQSIFRITKFDYLLKSIDTNLSYFAWPEKWLDPYDSIFMKVPAKIGEEEPVSHGYRDEYFCQCWCEKDGESDAMWRLYSDLEKYDGVLITSTVRKVFDSIYDDSDQFSSLYTFGGRVIYKPINDFQDPYFFEKNMGKFVNILNPNGRGMASTLMFKIDAYSHEHEVRFVVGKKSSKGQDHIDVPHQPNFVDIIDSVIFDPRAHSDFVIKATDDLDKRGYRMKIKQSSLYTSKPKIYKFSGYT